MIQPPGAHRTPNEPKDMKKLHALILGFLLGGTAMADVSIEKINHDLGELMGKGRFAEAENYIRNCPVQAVRTNQLLLAHVMLRQGRVADATAALNRYISGSTNRPGALEEALLCASDHPEVARQIQSEASRRHGLQATPAAEVHSSLQKILRESKLPDLVREIEAHWALVEKDKTVAYEAIRAASLKHQVQAGVIQTTNGPSLERQAMHGQLAEDLYRLLERIDPDRFASVESQTQLASILQTRENYTAALEIVTALRQLAASEWMEREGELDMISALCLEGMGLVDRAREAYERIISRAKDPRYEAYAEVARLKFTPGNLPPKTNVGWASGMLNASPRTWLATGLLVGLVGLAIGLRQVGAHVRQQQGRAS